MISGVPSSTSKTWPGLSYASCKPPLSVVSGEVFNVGSYHLNYSLGEVAEKIREQIPEVEIEYKENPDKRNYRASLVSSARSD